MNSKEMINLINMRLNTMKEYYNMLGTGKKREEQRIRESELNKLLILIKEIDSKKIN